MKSDPDVPSGFSNAPLIALAGITWASVGIALLALAAGWLTQLHPLHISLLVAAGIVSALLVHHLGFLRIVDKNLNRILTMDRQHSLFSFIPWKSYLLIVLMITAGSVLRHSAIPKQYLAIVYICMGLALLLSSARYFRLFFSAKKNAKS